VEAVETEGAVEAVEAVETEGAVEAVDNTPPSVSLSL